LSSLAKDKPARQPAAKKKGDLLDAMLEAAAKANDPEIIMAGKVRQFPEDVQDTLTELIRLYRWPVGAIPDPPRNGKGGKYAQWIKELREIDKITAGHGVEALEMSVRACRDITVSHPGAMTWCLAGEVGKLSDRQAKDTIQQEPEELLTFTPPPEELRRAAYERMQGYSNA
jgi:hypothetical protein